MVYIYPYGGFGRQVGKILELFDIEFIPIDDNISGQELETIKPKITKDDLVLISVSSNYESFEKRLGGGARL